MENKANHKIVILTGCDKVGKTSIWQEINSQTRYKHFMIDRFVEGFQAYKEIFNKSDDLCNLEELKVFEENMKRVPHILIHLTCSADEIRRRCKETGHEEYDVELHQEIYKKYVDLSTLNKYTIDTTNKSAKEVVEELINKKVI